jgi:hypothetical protein
MIWIDRVMMTNDEVVTDVSDDGTGCGMINWCIGKNSINETVTVVANAGGFVFSWGKYW